MAEGSSITSSISNFVKKLLPLQNSPEYEITVSTGGNDSLKVKCYASIPRDLPVIPWYTLVTSDDQVPPNKRHPFVKLTQPEETEQLFTTYKAKSNLKAVIVAKKDCNVKYLQTSFKHHPPILIIPNEKIQVFNGFIESSRMSNETIKISSVPLTLTEKDENIQNSILYDSTKAPIVQVFDLIREGIRRNANLSVYCRNEKQEKRILKELLISLYELPQYPQAYEDKLSHDGELLLSILQHKETFDRFFFENFPVYIAVGYWLCSFITIDRCEELKKFLNEIFKGFQSPKITPEIENFLSKPDFHLNLEFKFRSSSMMWRIAEHLIFLLSELHRIEESPKIIRETFFSVSLANRFMLISLEDSKEKIRKNWKKHLVEPLHSVQLTETMISDIQAGLVVMKELLNGLPELMINWKYLQMMFSSLIYPPSFIKMSLERLSETILVKANYSQSFLNHFLRPVLNQYNVFKRQNGPHAFVTLFKSTFVEIVNEGFELVDCINTLISRNFWESSSDFGTILCEFMEYFVSLIDMRHESSVNLIADLTQRQTWYTSYTSGKILDALHGIHDSLKVNDFVLRIKAGNFQNQNIMRDFLSLCEKPKSLKDPGVIDFLQMYSRFLNNEDDRRNFLIFIKAISDKYASKKNFFVDLTLLKPDTDGFFDATMSSLETLLDSIFNKTKDCDQLIHSIILEMMDLLPDEYSYFHEKYAVYFLKKFTKHCSNVHANPPNALLRKSCEIINDDSMDTSTTSVKLIFSWRFLNKVAELVVIKPKTFSWLNYDQTLVYLVGGHLLSKVKAPMFELTSLNSFIINLCDALKFVTKQTKEKNLTHTDLIHIQASYDSYAEAWKRLMPEDCACVELSFINSSLSSYDQCVKFVNYYLIRSSKIKEHDVEIFSVLKIHGIDVPHGISVQIQACLVLKCSDSRRSYKPDQKTSLSALESLTLDVETFLKVVVESMDTLIFMAEQQSYILNNCMTKYKSQYEYFTTVQDSFSSSIEDLKKLDKIVKASEEDVFALTKGCSSLKAVKSIVDFEFIRDQSKLDKETEVIRSYLEVKRKGFEDIGVAPTMKEGLIAYSILFSIKDDLRILYNTCDSFELEDCTNDPQMKEIQLIEQQLSCEAFHKQITLNDCVEKLDKVKNNLTIDDVETTVLFQLVSTVQKCKCLYRFCQYRKFASVEGYQNFISQHKLVTIAVDKEDYCEQILNELRGAMLFMSPFFHKNTTLFELMSNLKSLTNVPVGIFQLNQVESNIHTVEIAFNQIEGETHELVMTTLKAILRTGQFCFYLSGSSNYDITLYLQFHPLFQYSEVSQTALICWNLQRIEKFSRKLAFFSAEKRSNVEQSDEGDLTWFNKQFDRAKSLLSQWTTLQTLGGRLKIKAKECFDVKSINFLQLENQVISATKSVQELKRVIREARMKHKELSLVTRPKMKVVYNRIQQGFYDYEDVVDDLGIFFTEPPTDQYKCIIEMNIEKFFEDRKSIIQTSVGDNGCSLTEDFNPAEITGQFIQTFLCPSIPNKLKVLAEPHCRRNQNQTSAFQLYTAIKFSNMDLVRIIFWIFEEFPLPFQLLRCSIDTSKEELCSFFERIKHFSDFKYLIMGINHLSMEVQQVLITLCSKTRSDVLKGCYNYKMPDICFVEYAPSIFQNMPWMTVAKVDMSTIKPSKEETKEYCMRKLRSRFKIFQVVKGLPGSGKSQMIRKRLSTFHQGFELLNIDETFESVQVIKGLKQKIHHTAFDFALYLNISLIFNNQETTTTASVRKLADEVHWFFFDYLLLGYVEDYNTGLSIRFPEPVQRSIYVEVPYWKINEPDTPLEDSFTHFCEVFPVFYFLGEPVIPNYYMDYSGDPGTQLVCKYLRRYESGNLDVTISRRGLSVKPLKIGEDGTVNQEMCESLLERHIVPSKLRKEKIREKLFLKYMERRCEFMENCPQLMFNYVYYDEKTGLDKRRMRSTLFKIMLKEVKDFCEEQTMCWNDVKSQLIYNFTGQDASFSFISCNPDAITDQERADLKAIGIQLSDLNIITMNSHKQLHKYLSVAFGVRLNEDGELDSIKNANYVLTKDYTLKMLNIHERKECGMPVVIEGETGVGKTFLVEMLSILWNESWKKHVDLQKDILKDEILKAVRHELVAGVKVVDKQVESFLEAVESEEKISYDRWLQLANSQCSDGIAFHQKLRSKLDHHWYDPSIACLEIPKVISSTEKDLWETLELYDKNKSAETFAQALCGLLYGEIKPCFYKLNIHSALTPAGITEFFNEVVRHAEAILTKSKRLTRNGITNSYQLPNITVFLDEVNTASCPGFLKQIIVDRTINNRLIPSNVFVISACNPYRGNSQISTDEIKSEQEVWLRPSYYVQPLAPTLEMLKWNYGSLREEDEIEYVKEKMKLCFPDENESKVKRQSELSFLAKVIHKGQTLIREYAAEQLKLNAKLSDADAKQFSKSCVSQRDIQRVFVLYEWLLKWFEDSKHYEDESPFSHKVRAIFVSIGIAYYFRLNATYREKFEEEMNNMKKIGQQGIPVTFSDALNNELDLMVKKFKLPLRVAPTLALKENIYATVVCILNKMPLIIVGPPGSSKTLSFKIISTNLRGVNSESKAFQNEEMFPPVDQHSYQCSRRSTSTEIEAVFERAIKRKKMLDEVGINNCSVILMDEAGLTEESHESLKVLHYYLDKSKVSFVGLSNHILDAAKTNRAISLYRSKSTMDDLVEIAITMFPSLRTKIEKSQRSKKIVSSVPICAPAVSTLAPLEESLQFIERFLEIYIKIMPEHFRMFYGIRDVVHFLLYLYRKKKQEKVLSPKSVVEALERNFNGKKDILDVLTTSFLSEMDVDPKTVRKRENLEVFKSSLEDLPEDLSVDHQVRYKLIIDSTEDDSLIGILLAFKILERQSTSILVCTKFKGDPESEKTNTIASLRYLAAHGHTVVLLNCEDIEESFYDLFNQNFSSIDQSDGTKKYYANIAMGAQMRICYVDPKFQCIVVIKEGQVKNTPGPYLNRFEKYSFTHKSVLEDIILTLPKPIATIIQNIRTEIFNLVDSLDEGSFHGLCNETVSSLMLTTFKSTQQCTSVFTSTDLAIKDEDSCLAALMKEIILNGTKMTSICFAEMTSTDFDDDIEYLEAMVQNNEQLQTVLSTLDKPRASVVAVEAIKLLLQQEGDVTDPEAQLVHFCIKSWLLLALCKKLLYVMKPEALVIHRSLKTHFKMVYLKSQCHFSLPALISQSLDELSKCSELVMVNDDSSSIKPMVNGDSSLIEQPKKPPKAFRIRKTICFTRTTHVIQELFPLKYDNVKFGSMNDERPASVELKNYFDKSIDGLCIYSFTNATSSQEVSKAVKRFLVEDHLNVQLFIANMKIISTDVINHTRIMINEIEHFHQELTSDKLIILLLHFPSTHNSKAVYPTIFLHDWNHCYLDNVGGKESIGNINIVSWLSQCCFDSKVQDMITAEEFVTLETLHAWINELLPMISADISIKTLSEWPEESTLISRVDIWKSFLVEKQIGEILIKRFQTYWASSKIRDVSNKASVISRARSSLGMTSIIEAEVHQAFRDYLLYTLTRLNKHHGLHILLSESHTGHTPQHEQICKLFQQVLEVMPLPSKLELCKATILDYERKKKNAFKRTRALTFPFFRLIFDHLEAILDVVINEFQCGSLSETHQAPTTDDNEAVMELSLNELHSAFNSPTMTSQIIQLMLQKVHKEAENTSYLKIVLEDYMKSDHIWARYVNDAVAKRMDRQGELGCKLMSEYFCRALGASSGVVDKRLCAFHVSLRFQNKELNFSSFLFIVHCIDDISKYHLYKKDLLLQEFESQDDLDDLPVVFSKIIKMLFSAVVDILKGETYTKFDHVCDIYYRLVNVIASEQHMKQLKQQIVNYWLLVHMCVEVRNALISTSSKGKIMTSSEDFMLKFLERFSSEISQDDVISIKDVADAIMAILFDETDLLHYAPNKKPSKIVIQLLDFVFTLYVLKMKIIFFNIDDFHWMLKIINACENPFLLNLLQKHLKAVLLNNDAKDDPKDSDNVLAVFNSKYRTEIGEFLRRQGDAVYLPPHYRPCPYLNFNPQNTRPNTRVVVIDETVANTYFLLVVQQLLWKNHREKTTTSDIMTILENLNNALESSNDAGIKFMLLIEKEALIYAIITQLARNLVKSGEIELAEIGEVLPSVNGAFNCTYLGIISHQIQGHGIFFALRLLQAYNSSYVFSAMMTRNYKLHFEHFECLSPLPNLLKNVKQPDISVDLPLLQHIKTHHKRAIYDNLYKRIQIAIRKVLSGVSKAERGFEELTILAQNCYVDGKELEEHKKPKWSFNMMLFIVIAEELFLKKRSSRMLATKIKENLNSFIELDYFNFILWFTDASYFRTCYEVLPEDYYHLETFLTQCRDDSSKHVLLRVIIQLLAVIIGFPKKYTHFWTHLCCPTDLMYDPSPTLLDKIKPNEEQFYIDCNTFMKLEKIEFTRKGSLNLQSLAFIYMLNYGALSLSIMANDNLVKNPLKGNLVHSTTSSCKFFLQNFEKMWNEVVCDVLHIVDDQKVILVEDFLIKLYQGCADEVFYGSYYAHRIRQSSYEGRTLYERSLHKIFLDSWKTMKKSRKYEALSKLGRTLCTLESKTVHPNFSEQEVKQSFLLKILSSTNLENAKNSLVVLYRFLLRRYRINTGGRLLPYLLYCYNFMADKWSYLLTKEEAGKEDSADVLRYLDNYLSKHMQESKDDVFNQFKTMISLYSTYSQVNKLDPLPSTIIGCISYERHDGALYKAIFNIIEEYNKFIDDVRYCCATIPSLCHIQSMMNTNAIPVSEIDSKTCCIGTSLNVSDIDDIFPLIEKHCMYLTSDEDLHDEAECVDDTFLPDYIPMYFNLEEIQKNIVQSLLVHKRPVSNKKLKKEFKFFQKEITEGDQFNRGIHSQHTTSIVSIDILRTYLDETYKNYMVPLPDDDIVEFKSLFHNLHYNAMLKVFIGLSLLVKYLSQVLSYRADIDSNLENYAVSRFINSYLGNVDGSTSSILEPIGIKKQTAIYIYSGVNEEQYSYLFAIKMKNVFSIAEILSGWIGCGIYDFQHLPFSMKTELESTFVDEIRLRIQGSGKDPRATAQLLMDILVENESNLRKEVYQNTQSILCDVIQCGSHKWKGSMPLNVLLEGIQVQNYVYLIITLRTILGDYLAREVAPHIDHTPTLVDTPVKPSTPPQQRAAVHSNDLGHSSDSHKIPSTQSSPAPLKRETKPPQEDKEQHVDHEPDEEIIIPSLTQADTARMHQRAKEISTDEFMAFLRTVGLSDDTLALIEEMEISASVLCVAMEDDEQLEDELEIDKAYLRLKLKVLFKRFLLNETTRIARLFPTHKVVECFNVKKLTAKHAQIIEEQNIDGEMLWLADDNALKDLGIKGIAVSMIRVNFKEQVLKCFKENKDF